MKVNIKRISAFTASLLLGSTLGLSTVAAADSMPGWGGGWGWNPGFDRFNNFNNRISNMNDVRISNLNNQFAQSGDAAVFGNRFGGNAITGDAINSNRANFDVDISNF